MDRTRFRKTVWSYYHAHGRHDLPWRKTNSAYRILVSEIMLQQTQVDRVIPLYKDFIKKFPTAKKLAGAPLSEVVKAWQGLGYNRRAKMLHQAAKDSIAHGMPRTVAGFESLPGVGPYTARAVAAFAYNQDVIVIETNIRTAVIHHFFTSRAADVSAPRVTDVEIATVLASVVPKGRAREWYSALMDYGASLKRAGISHNTKTQKYAKQSKFAGSLREARGAILKRLALGSASRATLTNLLGAVRRSQVSHALDALCAEGLVQKSGRNFALAN